MALKKTITLANGASGEYIKVERISFERCAGEDEVTTFDIMYALYTNEALRRAEKPVLSGFNLPIDVSAGIDAVKVDFANPIAMAYKILKALPQMSGAIDC